MLACGFTAIGYYVIPQEPLKVDIIIQQTGNNTIKIYTPTQVIEFELD
ncbi:unnamed protein product [marine sediment metagenome]|uniref:Uncharacterized protein n=1 Tax=marine sediment metagenome TaxID=412755 RepID=X1A618_9ZZZZ